MDLSRQFCYNGSKLGFNKRVGQLATPGKNPYRLPADIGFTREDHMANRLKFQLPDRAHDTAWDPEKALATALTEKMEFLDQHPQHRDFQQEIDRLLDKAGAPENRMTVLAMLMEGKLLDLRTQLQKLNRIVLKSGIKPNTKGYFYTNPNLTKISNN
jgi:hypothetical protein